MIPGINFNSQHSRIGTFASFTLGVKGARGGLGLELGRPTFGAENVPAGERETLDGEFITNRLEARSATLWDILS